ncbi:ABC-2 type transport system permease protein [Planomicrobium stackebrandtii]|uniref:ABC-2 type transport system permease protein n=1 Tax=Planomicrobium stackebrandtii TaxID=253160 RepID=A0ABU0GVL1_9BACL|nr:ABC transporter permease [Planomicrobium stackebrandtii]MDQ0429401.1 ABC-2 type transport system permease protein [Planomicrobium stackebrandtii]
MRNTKKVAKWEIKRNMKNKTFLIGLFISPILFLAFYLIPDLFNNSDEDAVSTTVFVNDQLGVYENLEATVQQAGAEWELQPTDISEEEAAGALESEENSAYVFIDERAFDGGVLPVYQSEEISPDFINEVQLLGAPLQAMQIEELGLTPEEASVITQGVVFEEASPDASAETEAGMDDAFLERIVPGIFAAAVLLSIVFTGMAIFQSASQEKKDKIAEIILSSLTPGELMQGKIIGYFVLGIIQVLVFIVLVLPVLVWKIDVPILEYLFVPELALMLVIAVLGYLLFAALFVGIGATMADISTAGNFQGMIMMLPFAALIFVGPVFNDPSGIWAQVGSYIPFTSPAILILRLSLLEEWPWIEIIIGLAILIVSVWVFMKLAGKIFKIGILMYGKNATPGEIWKWIRA